MANAVSIHLGKISKSKKMELKARDSGIDIAMLASSVTMHRLLEGVHVYRVHDQTELLALINQLPGILTVNTRVRLIIIDSIAFHFRQNLQDTAHRSRLLGSLSQQLNQIAYESNVAIVTTNHMTTKFESSSSGGIAAASAGRGFIGGSGAISDSVTSFGSSSSSSSSTSCSSSSSSYHQQQSP